MSDKRTYKEKLLDPRWQKMRLQVLERDGWACRCCGAKDKTLHAHHTFYAFDAEPWGYPAHTIITVCADCHESEHDGWGYERELLVGRVVVAGFGTNAAMREISDAFSMLRELSQEDAEKFAKALKLAALSRYLALGGKTEGRLWNTLLAIADEVPVNVES